MLDNIIDQIKGKLGPEIMEKFGLDEKKTEQVFSTAKETIKTNVKKEASGGGGLDGLLNMFSKGENNAAGNSMQEKIGGELITKLSSNLGLEAGQAAGIKDMILSQVTKMMGDKGGNFDIGSLLSMVTGGGKAGGAGLLGKLFSMFTGKK